MSTATYRVLLVDDDAAWCERPIVKLEENGFEVLYEERAENTLRKIKSFDPHVVLLDILFGNKNKGKPTFKKIKEKCPVPVIMLTSTMKDTFDLEDYPGCAFPFAKDQLNVGTDEAYRDFSKSIRRAIEKSLLTPESLEKVLDFVVGETEVMAEVCKKIDLVASTDTTVLITGESGVGKELVARAIHSISSRGDKPFIAVNCGAIPENLIESELFGHEKGAFTGAVAERAGRFELAHGGTLFLDEAGDLTLDTQVKLLRALQEGEIQRVGGAKVIQVDVRVIAATNKDLGDEIKKNKFREDLFYRLDRFSIFLPPLRERKEDIPDLLVHFIEEYNKKLGKKILIETEEGRKDYLRPDVLELLMNRDWPGNIREFENTVERAMIEAGEGNVLLPAYFDIQTKKEENLYINIDMIVDEVFEGKWKGEDTWKKFIKKYTKDGGFLKKIFLKCIDRLKKELKRDLKHRDMANLFGIKEGNMRKTTKTDIGIDWKTVRKYQA